MDHLLAYFKKKRIFVFSITTSFLFLLFVKTNTAQTKPRIFINEFLASNLTTNPDMVDFGDFSDWIELYNDESTNINIGGYYLSDDFSEPMKWQFPQNTILPAKGYFLVWADGYNDIPGQNYTREWWPHTDNYTTRWCHTNFKLDKDNEEIGLYDSNGINIDSVTFSNQVEDVSYGRKPDGASSWFYFGEPTPLKSNSGQALTSINYSGDVLFSQEGGFYQNAITVALSSSSGGIIRYTTDGTKPTSSSTQYNSLITINSNTMLRARVFENSKLPGKTFTNSYFINETRNLPVVSLVTDPKFLWDKDLGIYLNTYKERQIPVSLEYFPLNSSRTFFVDAGARIGGENIYRFAEKPINIYASSDYGYSHISYNIFDDLPFNEYKRLYLRNGGDDWPYTMFRDGLQVNILKNRMGNSTQDFKPSVLYLNGQYWGIYNLREKIDEQYFLLHYNVDPSNLDHLESSNTVISGDSTDFVNLLSFAEANSLVAQVNYNYVAARIDLHNLMDFVIAQDYFANSSWGHNREVWRDNKNENLWRWIMVDMDRGFDADRTAYDQFSDIYYNFDLFRELLENTGFKNEFVQRYAEHLNHTFNSSRVVTKIDSLKSLIENEIPRHVQKWGTYIDSLSIDIWGQTPGITSVNSWNTEVQKLRNFANNRAAYAIQYLNSKLNLTGTAKLTIDSNIPDEGKITINGFSETFGDENLYFKDIPLNLAAYPPPGYKFKQWDKVGSSSSMEIFPAGAEWKYRDENSGPDNSWKDSGFNDAGWKSGNGQFGYGDGDENTVINYGSDSQNKYITYYYRKTFQVDNAANVKELDLKLLCDDGAVIYINGNEVLRRNMPSGTVTYSTFASSVVSSPDESTFFDYSINNANLVNGENIIAVEIHQANSTSSDISFDMSMNAVLLQQSNVATVIGTDPSIQYTLTSDTDLIAEFEESGSTTISSSINDPMTLTKADSPYYISTDVTIEKSGSLTVEPGCELLFLSGKSLYVKGILMINGTESEPVTLTSYYPSEKWGAVCFDNASGTSELNYVNISNATNGNDQTNFFAAVSSLNSSVLLKNVSFNNVKLPVSSQWSNLTIDGCTFKNVTEIGDYVNCNGGNLSLVNSVFEGNNFADMDAVDLGFMTGTTEIKNNTIKDFTGGNSDGIDLGDGCINVNIENNVINNCCDKGISIGGGSNALLMHNVLANCNEGIGIKDSLSFVTVQNCTFYSNVVGVACFEKVDNRGGGKADITSSLFAESSDASFTYDHYSNININYSLSDKDDLPGTGNVTAKPFMINPVQGNFHLRVNSPCINNGDPQSFDDDGSRRDIGAFAFAGLSSPDIVINEINYNSSSNFDPDDWIELYNTTGNNIDLSGWIFADENESPSYVFDSGTILQPQSYLVVCKSKKSFKSFFSAINNYVGNMDNGLDGNGEAISLYDSEGKLVDSLRYNDKSPWPTEADGSGSTLELQNPKLDNGTSENWRASAGHGTPGMKNSVYITEIDNNVDEIPTEYKLMQNYPNPFNPTTVIGYQLPIAGHVSLIVYDILGRQISKLVDEYKQPGNYKIAFNGQQTTNNRQLTSGIYFARLNVQPVNGSNQFDSVIKMLLVK